MSEIIEKISKWTNENSGFLSLLLFVIPITVVASRRMANRLFSKRKNVTIDASRRYLEHEREFEEYVRKIKDKFPYINFGNIRALHENLYPAALSGDLNYNADLIDKTKFLLYQMIDTNHRVNPSPKNRYTPILDVVGGMNMGLHSEIKNVSFAPRDEVFVTALYGCYGIINARYIDKVRTGDAAKDLDLSEEYGELATILHLLLKFIPSMDLSFIPINKNKLLSMDAKKYRKQHGVKNKKMTVHYFAFGMVMKAEFE